MSEPRSSIPQRVRRRLATALPGPGRNPAADEEIAALRQRLRRNKARLAKSKQNTERLRTLLHDTRGSLRDPFPGVPQSSSVSGVIEGVRREGLTYLSPANLRALASVMAETELAGREGLVIEAGTALGGSAIVIAAAKSAGRPMKVYDVFGMIPEPTDADGADVHKRYEQIRGGAAAGVKGETYYGYRQDLFTEVTGSFARHGVPVAENDVELVKGLFSDTIHLDEPVAFAHLDGDWYESTMTCLERIAPLLVTGGRVVLDDYYAWSGCRDAVNDYFRGRPGYHLELRAKVHVVRL